MDMLLGWSEHTAGKHTYGQVDRTLSWAIHLAYDRSNIAFFWPLLERFQCWYNPTGCASVVPIRLSLAGDPTLYCPVGRFFLL